MTMSISSLWSHTRWKLVLGLLSLVCLSGVLGTDSLSGNSLSLGQDENEFISMAKKVGLRFVDGKDREGADDLGNDEDFLLDLFESKNLHKMAQIVGQMNHVFTTRPESDILEPTVDQPEASTRRLPMKSHTHKDDSPTELVLVNDVAEPIFWENPDSLDSLKEEATTFIPEYLTETLYYFEKDQKNASRPFSRTPRTPKSLDFETNLSHKSRKILQVFEDAQEEQDHMMMMLHNAVAMVEMEDVLQNLRPIPFNEEGSRPVLRTQTTRPPVQTQSPDFAPRKTVKKPRKKLERLQTQPRPQQRARSRPTQSSTFVPPPTSPQPLSTVPQRFQNDPPSPTRFTPRPAPRFNTQQPNTFVQQEVSPKILPVQEFFPSSGQQARTNEDFTPQVASPTPSFSPTPATPTTPRFQQETSLALTQPTSPSNAFSARNQNQLQEQRQRQQQEQRRKQEEELRRRQQQQQQQERDRQQQHQQQQQQPAFAKAQRPLQGKSRPITRPASAPELTTEARFQEPSFETNLLSLNIDPSPPSRQGKQIANEVQSSSLTEIPQTSFSCRNQAFPGLYADPEADCQVFYMCHGNGRQNGFLCPAGTLFDQRFLVCNWWHKVDCSRAQSLYSINEGIYQ